MKYYVERKKLENITEKNSNKQCKINIQNRWSILDKDFAKILFDFNVLNIKRISGKIYFIYNGLIASLPDGIFNSLKEGEAIFLKDIISEE